MELKDNFSLSRLFITKDITIFVDNKTFNIRLKPIKDWYEDNEWNSTYHLWTAPLNKIQPLYVIPLKSQWYKISLILFQLGAYDKYRSIYTTFVKYLSEIIPEVEIDMTNKKLIVKGITITEEIWEYILYILQYGQGEKVTKPLTFDSEEARQFYLAQKANEERIASIRQNKQGDADAMAKILLSITYAFPSMTIDYLINQTMAQIQWLQKHAAGAMSYEVNAQAFAAGNMKKGKKLEFFIK